MMNLMNQNAHGLRPPTAQAVSSEETEGENWPVSAKRSGIDAALRR